MAGTLPPEIWLEIHRLAVAGHSPLPAVSSEHVEFGFDYGSISSPFNEIGDFLRDARSFSLVNKRWNDLANVLLFQNIVINSGFDGLHSALQRPEIAHLVRSVRFSNKRFDHNVAALACCSRVEIIVQPDERPRDATDTSVWVANDPSSDINLELCSLKRIHWVESDLSTGLLSKIFRAAPGLEFLFLVESGKPPTHREPLDLPSTSNVRKLRLVNEHMSWEITRSILRVDFAKLTELCCAPGFLEQADFPETLPFLSALHLAGLPSRINFPRVFTRFPRLKDLTYSMRDSFLPPGEMGSLHAPLSLLRLYNETLIRVQHNWPTVERHLALIISSQFPKVQRIAFCGNWESMIPHRRFARFHEALRRKGCKLEYPEDRALELPIPTQVLN